VTSIVSIVTVFMATFVLVFGYLSFSEQEAPAASQTPTAVSPEFDR
jgi:flagellar basal body-associated protein FliL